MESGAVRFFLLFIQEAVQDAGKQCAVQGEPAGRWDTYSTTRVSPAAFAVSPLSVSARI